MKIGFFGTPEIGAYCLEKLKERHEVVFAAAPKDKPSGRSRHTAFAPVKAKAIEYEIPMLQPDKLTASDFKGFGADIFVVVAYGKLIPAEVFNLPPLGTVNLHPSLLPKYRGAAPIQWALINGERETGISVQLINEKLDAGDIIIQKRVNIDENINAEELYGLIIPQGAELLLEAVELLAAGRASRKKQNEEEATFCGKITRYTAKVDWLDSASNIHNLIRGLFPKPAAWTEFKGSEIKLLKAAPFPLKFSHSLEAGELCIYEKKRLIAGTGAGLLELLELRPETKKTMSAADFINGYRLSNGSRLE